MSETEIVEGWETVHGYDDGWHLTCAGCTAPIYPGDSAWVRETADEHYIDATGECCRVR